MVGGYGSGLGTGSFEFQNSALRCGVVSYVHERATFSGKHNIGQLSSFVHIVS